jgi:hypothetical protein
MRRSMRIPFLFFLILGVLSFPALAQRATLDTFLPSDTAGWHLTEPPQSFVGDELFNMIDGGAALYQEYGFDRAISAKYENGAGGGVDVEVYAMSDSGSAYGIFGITAAAGERSLTLGDEGEMGEYFLVFRKGRHVVTVSGQNTEKRTMEGVKLIGQAVDARVDSGRNAPELVTRFTSLVSQGSRPIYLRGVIALGNFYIFAPQNVFNVREGVTGECDSVRFFVFRYPNPEESARSFDAAAGALHINNKYSRFQSSSDHFTAADRDGNLLLGSTVGNAIIVVIGRNDGVNKKLQAEVAQTLSGR